MKLRIIINALRKLHASKQTYIYVSCAAYYLIISFIPMTLLFFSIMSFLPFASNLEILIQQLLPEGFSDLLYKIMDWIRKKRSVSLLSISGLVTIWSASKSMMYVSTGLDHVMNISSREKRLQTRLRAIYTLLPLPFLLYTIFIFYISIGITPAI